MLVGMTREELNALCCDFPAFQDEVEHFYVCQSCGQAVDCRRLGDVLHHEEPEHEPLALQ